MLQAQLVRCPPHPRISHLSPTSHGFFYWRMIIKTKIWVQGLNVDTEVSLFLGLLSWQSKEKYACTTCVHTYTYTCFYVYPLVTILNWVHTDASNCNPLPHGSFTLLCLLICNFSLQWWETMSLASAIYLHNCSIPVHIHSGFWTVNVYPHGKQLDQLQYSSYVLPPLPLVFEPPLIPKVT